MPVSAFPLQNLMGAYGDPTPINDWIFQKPGATIDTPSNPQATEHLEQWIKAGYFCRCQCHRLRPEHGQVHPGGTGLFLFNGDWESAISTSRWPARRASSRCRWRSRGQARRDVGTADLRASAPRPRTPTAPRSSSTGWLPMPTPARSTSMWADPTGGPPDLAIPRLRQVR